MLNKNNQQAFLIVQIVQTTIEEHSTVKAEYSENQKVEKRVRRGGREKVNEEVRQEQQQTN